MASVSADQRGSAALILARVDGRGAHAARLLGRSSPLVRELVLGVLRWQQTLDTLLGRHTKRAFASLDPEVRAVLRVGLYEAAKLSTPVPVAVSEAVRVAKALAPRAAGVVNAVLRRVVSEPWPDPEKEDLPLALRYSHPAWLVDRWRRLLGETRLREVLAANQRPAPLSLLEAASDADALRALGCVVENHPWVEGVVVVRDGVEAAIAALQAGRAYAMDPTAALVGRLLPPAGMGPIVDLTAAPGGKSLVIAAAQPDAVRLAGDRHLGRVDLLRRTMRLARSRPHLVAFDARRPPLRPQSCAAVLLDAPCSGTGTLRRHPEIRWRLRAEDLVELTALQRRLALAAAELVAEGGVLLYATCSLEPEENADVVASLGLAPVKLAGRLPAAAPVVPLESGGVVVAPGAWGDGFTVHLMQRA